MSEDLQTKFTFKDVINILNVNGDNYNETIDEFIVKFMEIREQSKRDVYRFKLSDIDSLTVTVSDITEILDTKKSDSVILDITLKYQIENHNTSYMSGIQSTPFNFKELKHSSDADELLTKIKSLKVLESQDILTVNNLPYTIKGFVITNEVPKLTVNATASNLPTTAMTNYFKEKIKASDLLSPMPEYVFSITINIGISNFKSKFMR